MSQTKPGMSQTKPGMSQTKPGMSQTKPGMSNGLGLDPSGVDLMSEHNNFRAIIVSRPLALSPSRPLASPRRRAWFS